MNQLTNRLKAIALEINQGETMADIGTDHGFATFSLAVGEMPQSDHDRCEPRLIAESHRQL